MEKNKTWTTLPITWLGSFLVARELLLWSKGNVEDEDSDSALAKLNKQNFITRVTIIATALVNFGGPTLDAATYIQAGGSGFFNDVTAEALQEQLTAAVTAVGKAKNWKFRAAELGSMDFSKKPVCQDCDGCNPHPESDGHEPDESAESVRKTLP
mgnify:CR=1 FL=1